MQQTGQFKLDEEARLRLAQVYTLLLDLARQKASDEDVSTDDLNAPETAVEVRND